MIRKYLTEEKGIVYIQGGGMRAPLDTIFDYIRGFKETIMDMRRHKEALKSACKAVMEDCIKPLKQLQNPIPLIPVYTTPVHALPFINKKQFEEFWWPTYKPLVELIVQARGKVKIRGEGSCLFAMDYFANEFEPGTFIWQFDQDDPYDVYAKYKDNFIFQCGIDNNTLKICSKQECIDQAKRAVDTFAPGGGFLFSTSKVVLCVNEINAENIIVVHDYGRY